MRSIFSKLGMVAGLVFLFVCPALAQMTATFTPTFTWTIPVTFTISPTNTHTNTPTNTNTPTSTPTNTYTPTGSPIPTSTYTITPSSTNTSTIMPTPWTLTSTPTNSMTNTPTNTPTDTPTNTPTPSITVTACATNTLWGETTAAAGSVSLTGTLFQQYTLIQPAQVNILTTQLQLVQAGTTVAMGIYSDNGTYPDSLIFATQPQAAYNGSNLFFTGATNIHLNPGTYWLAVDVLQGGSAYVTGGGGVTPAMTQLNGIDMPLNFPANLVPPVDNTTKLYLSSYINTCAGYVATTTPYPTATSTVTPSPTPAATPVTVTIVYVNNINTCAGAFGCSVSFATACRQLNLDFTTTYILMLLGASCGCQPSDIMTLRLTMSWDEICAHYGLDWATFAADLQNRINTLLPEVDNPNMLLRGAANDPTQFPIDNPGPMPATLTTGNTSQEVCPLCQ